MATKTIDESCFDEILNHFSTNKWRLNEGVMLEILARHRIAVEEQAKAEERATIMSEIANGGKSCHWCIKENRRVGAIDAQKGARDSALAAARPFLTSAELSMLARAIFTQQS